MYCPNGEIATGENINSKSESNYGIAFATVTEEKKKKPKRTTRKRNHLFQVHAKRTLFQ